MENIVSVVKMGRKPKNWKYEVKCIWTGSYEEVPKAEVREMIKESFADQYGFVPEDCEIKIEEDKLMLDLLFQSEEDK